MKDDPELRSKADAILKATKEAYGFVPVVNQVLSERPDLFVPIAGVARAVLEGDGFTLEHPGYDCGLTFREDGTPEGGSPASVVTVPFSDYKTGVFRYDSQQGVYLVEEYGQAYVDGNDGAQVAVTNVLVLQTACRVLDSAGRLSVDLTQGEGWYACGGSIIPILWSKGDRNSPLRYTDLQGNPLELGAGKSYVSIIPTSQTVTAS